MPTRPPTRTARRATTALTLDAAQRSNLARWLQDAQRKSGLSVPAMACVAGARTHSITNAIAGRSIDGFDPVAIRRIAWASGVQPPSDLLTAARAAATATGATDRASRALNWMSHPLAPILRPPYERSRRSMAELLNRIPPSYFDLSRRGSAVAELAAMIDLAMVVWSIRSTALRADTGLILKTLLCGQQRTYVDVARRFGTTHGRVHNLESRLVDFIHASANRWAAPHLNALLQDAASPGSADK